MARLGAQVVAGIGFIGAGTIIVTKRQRVKGLTTAAGLWTSAIIGLTFGGGFYEGGILATVFIMLAELVFSRIEYRVLENVPEINLYMEYEDKHCLDDVLQLYRSYNIKVLNIQITRSAENGEHNACAIFSLRLPQLRRRKATDTCRQTRGNCVGGRAVNHTEFQKQKTKAVMRLVFGGCIAAFFRFYPMCRRAR